MRYAKIENGIVVRYPVMPTDIVRENRQNVSFPKGVLSDSVMADFGCLPVVEVAQPSYDKLTHTVTELAPVEVNGVWTQQWEVVTLDAATVSANIDRKKSEVRATRNSLIVTCDWTQVADAPVDKVAWATYRQALRDVPTQVGFPYNVIWPTAPV